jgi:hypothetical protein
MSSLTPLPAAKAEDCPKHYLTVCVGLPEGVTVERGREAIRTVLGTTPEILLETALQDSLKEVPRFSGKNPRDHTGIARS